MTIKRKKNKEDKTATSPLPYHQESHDQLKEGRTLLVILRSSTSGSRGHPLDLPSGPHYAWTKVALAPRSVTRWQPTRSGPPADPIGSHEVEVLVQVCTISRRDRIHAIHGWKHHQVKIPTQQMAHHFDFPIRSNDHLIEGCTGTQKTRVN
jgi:hypothetical protein